MRMLFMSHAFLGAGSDGRSRLGTENPSRNSSDIRDLRRARLPSYGLSAQ